MTQILAWALRCAALAIVCGVTLARATDAPPHFLLPRQAFSNVDVALVVNDADSLSQRIAAYYARRRGIASDQIIHIRFAPGGQSLPPSVFAQLYAEVKRRTPASVQGYVLTWAAPYRVGCLSMTTAFAVGYDEAFCASGCRPTRSSPYFANPTARPYDKIGWRPTMVLSAGDFAATKALIDRGIAADGSWPNGVGYLVVTEDLARNTRAAAFERARRTLKHAIRLRLIHASGIASSDDVLFYFTGALRVPGIEQLGYLPGAVADHLTSTGGQLTDSRQMSSLQWLRAGATGTYGTVVEPCNYPGKFSDPGILIAHYLSGATLIEAYWRSVRMPGQGIFVGEPLARPFAGVRVVRDPQSPVRWRMQTHALMPGRYRLEGAAYAVGPYRPVTTFLKSEPGLSELTVPVDGPDFYRVVLD